jgi:hypothetical protein
VATNRHRYTASARSQTMPGPDLHGLGVVSKISSSSRLAGRAAPGWCALSRMRRERSSLAWRRRSSESNLGARWGVFYAQGVKANVLFFGRPEAEKRPATNRKRCCSAAVRSVAGIAWACGKCCRLRRSGIGTSSGGCGVGCLANSGTWPRQGANVAFCWPPVSVILRQKVAAGRRSLLKHWREFVSNSRGARRTLKPPTQGLSGENPGKTGLRRAVT